MTATQANVDAQGEVVRKLKAEKADKDRIAKEVAKLIALKTEVAAATGGTPATQTKAQKKSETPAAQPQPKTEKKAPQPKEQNPAAQPNAENKQQPKAVEPLSSDVSWAPVIPRGHTAFSWEDDNSSDEEAAAAPAAAAPRAATAKPLLSAGCKSVAAEPDAASTAKLLGEGPEPNFGALWKSSKGTSSFSSKLLTLNKGMLVWNVAGKGILQCSEADQAAFAEEVANAIANKTAGVSQGVHDKYVTYCVSKGKQIASLASGRSLYESALPLLHGIGVPTDKNKAIEMLKTSVEEGCAEAMSLLGYCYQLGDGVGVNEKLAAELYLCAARKGDGHGMVRLGRLYGKGVDRVLDKDPIKAEPLIKYGCKLLEAIYSSPNTSRAEKSRALSLLHSNMNLV